MAKSSRSDSWWKIALYVVVTLMGLGVWLFDK